MGGAFLSEVGENILWLLAGYLQPKCIRAEVQLAGPGQRPPMLPNASLPEKPIVGPGGKHPFSNEPGKLGFTFHPVVEPEPDAVLVEHLESNDLCHKLP
jgi:hypothetical protein